MELTPADALDAHSKEYQLQMRAVAITRRRYGISQSEMVTRWTPAMDKQAMAVYRKLMDGEPIPQHWRPSYREPPPIDPWATLLPRSASR